MLIDTAIILVAVGSFFYGRDIGFIRNFSSAVGFFFGLTIGAYVETKVITDTASSSTKSVLVIIMAFVLGIIFLTVGEYFGVRLKHKIVAKKYLNLDKYLGSVFSLLVLFFCVWLLSALSLNLPYAGLQKQVDKSLFITKLNSIATPAPIVIDDVAYKLSKENMPNIQNLESLGVDDSIYKIISQGCGQLKVGSGFKVSDTLVATNAHVVAGIKNPRIKTKSKIYSSEVVYIDTNLDFALLKTSVLPGKELPLDNLLQANGSAIKSLGYSGGGPLKIKNGEINNHFLAKSNNIFNDKIIKREIYDISTNLESGDSGGPIINSDNRVVGMAFAESTNSTNGYGLMSKSISPIISIAKIKNINQPVINNRCADD